MILLILSPSLRPPPPPHTHTPTHRGAAIGTALSSSVKKLGDVVAGGAQAVEVGVRRASRALSISQRGAIRTALDDDGLNDSVVERKTLEVYRPGGPHIFKAIEAAIAATTEPLEIYLVLHDRPLHTLGSLRGMVREAISKAPGKHLHTVAYVTEDTEVLRTARHLARVGRGTFHAAMPDGAWGDELAKLDKELTEVGREGGDGGSGGRRRLTN